MPKKYRRDFLDTLLVDEQLKERIFNEVQFHWIFNETPCSICQSVFNLLLDKDIKLQISSRGGIWLWTEKKKRGTDIILFAISTHGIGLGR